MSKKLVIDLDGTICTQESPGRYDLVRPRMGVIEKMDELYKDGWYITIFTARGMNTFHGNIEAIEQAYRKMTEDWLETYLVPYHRLIFGKPAADLYVDDKGMNPDEFASRNFDF